MNGTMFCTITSSHSDYPMFVIIDSTHICYRVDDEQYDVEIGFSFDANTSIVGTTKIKKSCSVEGTSVERCGDNLLTMSALIDMLYPIGSIYTSMNNKDPSLLFGGTWTQIVDRFLYCSNSSKQTGGSKKITVEQLPAHSHSITELDIRGNENGSNQYTIAKYGGKDTTITTGNTGSGKDYMPEYMTVFCWYRVA